MSHRLMLEEPVLSVLKQERKLDVSFEFFHFPYKPVHLLTWNLFRCCKIICQASQRMCRMEKINSDLIWCYQPLRIALIMCSSLSPFYTHNHPVRYDKVRGWPTVHCWQPRSYTCSRWDIALSWSLHRGFLQCWIQALLWNYPRPIPFQPCLPLYR